MATEIKLIKVTHQQSRLEYFKKRLKSAERSMNYAVKHNYHHDICSEKGEIVSFYAWAVEMAEREAAKYG